MKKAPAPTKTQGAFQNHTEQQDSIRAAYFLGTDNPRHLRVIHALWVSPQPREAIDNRAGCSNGPELVAELRRRGLEVPCQRTPCIDRDGYEIKRGLFYVKNLQIIYTLPLDHANNVRNNRANKAAKALPHRRHRD